jgi:glycosyltransferase involved in cell wall biosynthesis
MTEGNLNSEPEFSVVIPCFNAELTVDRAFKSVLNQSFPPKEVIFVNDASTDQTQSILNKFSLGTYSFSVRIFKNEINVGPGMSRNLGWNNATSNWIAFLDADDAKRLGRCFCFLRCFSVLHFLGIGIDSYLLHSKYVAGVKYFADLLCLSRTAFWKNWTFTTCYFIFIWHFFYIS